jgi:hypothetical protein
MNGFRHKEIGASNPATRGETIRKCRQKRLIFQGKSGFQSLKKRGIFWRGLELFLKAMLGGGDLIK